MYHFETHLSVKCLGYVKKKTPKISCRMESVTLTNHPLVLMTLVTWISAVVMSWL